MDYNEAISKDVIVMGYNEAISKDVADIARSLLSAMETTYAAMMNPRHPAPQLSALYTELGEAYAEAVEYIMWSGILFD